MKQAASGKEQGMICILLLASYIEESGKCVSLLVLIMRGTT